MQILVRFAAMLALLIVGCADLGEPLEPGSSIFDDTINGRSLWYPSGGTFDVVLEENFDAGYMWEYELSDSTVIRVDSMTSKYTPLPPPRPVGGSAIVTMHFSATRRGQCGVYLFEHQPWMKNVPPHRVVRFLIVVQP
jgi:predicted secreted protein